jgi:hypothetical protein
MNRFKLSFAVAVLLGLTSGQVLNATASTSALQAIQSITRIDSSVIAGNPVDITVTAAPTQQDILL